MHIPYESIKKHHADFRVKYRFRDFGEGGRRTLPYQGLRCDFSYDDPNDHSIYMIWPEFEDKSRNVILENKTEVSKEGTARMWILRADRRKFHAEKLKVGLKCFFWEGKITADCEVIEILDVSINPTS